MADNTKIEWTDATWNPVTGCSVVSPGCTNCYAMKLAGTRLQHHASRAGLTTDSKSGPVWNGKVRFNEKWLMQPLKWKRRRMIFVCAHGDLFHESVPDEWIDRVFAVMALAPQHTFQVLTKRAERMRDYCRTLGGHHERDRVSLAAKQMQPDGEGFWWTLEPGGAFLPNAWLGVSCEDQKRADERIQHLLETPAAVRFISAEPLLGPIDFRKVPGFNRVNLSLRNWWVIAGGESGHGARPMHPDWARSLRDQCAAAGVPFFFKQWGEWANPEAAVGDLTDGPEWRRLPFYDDRVFTFEDGLSVGLVGKKAAGRLLDGVEHNGMPEMRQ